jgi:hypothetical protein
MQVLNFRLSLLDGNNGFTINGIDVDDSSGFFVRSTGDINGDGFDDILIGVRDDDPGWVSRAGVSYVVFGRALFMGFTFIGETTHDRMVEGR